MLEQIKEQLAENFAKVEPFGELHLTKCNSFIEGVDACINLELPILFGKWILMQGIEYYDDLDNGINYTIEKVKNKTFTMDNLFEYWLNNVYER